MITCPGCGAKGPKCEFSSDLGNCCPFCNVVWAVPWATRQMVEPCEDCGSTEEGHTFCVVFDDEDEDGEPCDLTEVRFFRALTSEDE